MLNGNPKISLDEVLNDSGRARALPRSVRNDLLARFAAGILILSSADDSAEIKIPQPRGLQTAKQIAEHLGVKESWVMSEARANRIPRRKIGHYVRFELGEVKRALDDREA